MQSRRIPVFLIASLRLATGQIPKPDIVYEGTGTGGTCGDAGTCGAPATCGTATCGAPATCGTATCGQATCGQPMMQTYQPPPQTTYQQPPPQTTYQQPPPQTTYQTSYQYVPGKPVVPTPIDPPKQPPMFNLVRKISYEPLIKVFEHEVPYIHYESYEEQQKCDIHQVPSKIFKPDARNIVQIREEHRTKKALRVVQHFPEPVSVHVPMYMGTIDETSQTAHHRVWYDLPVEVTRVPPQMEIELPGVEKTRGHYVPVTRQVTVQPPPVPVTVQPPPVPVTVQPPPVMVTQQAPVCATGTAGTCGSVETYDGGTCGAAAGTCATGTCATGTCA